MRFRDVKAIIAKGEHLWIARAFDMFDFINNPLRRFQSVAASLQRPVGTKRTIEITASFCEYGTRNIVVIVLIKIKQLVGRQGRGIQIGNQFSANLIDTTIIPVNTAWNIINIFAFLQLFQKKRELELGFASEAVIKLQVFQPIAAKVIESGAA